MTRVLKDRRKGETEMDFAVSGIHVGRGEGSRLVNGIRCTPGAPANIYGYHLGTVKWVAKVVPGVGVGTCR